MREIGGLEREEGGEDLKRVKEREEGLEVSYGGREGERKMK